MCVSASATILTLLRSSFDWAPWSAPADSPGGRCLLAARPSCFSLIVDSSTLGISAHKQHDFLSELYEMIPFKPWIPVSSSSVRMHPNEGGADHIACKVIMSCWILCTYRKEPCASSVICKMQHMTNCLLNSHWRFHHLRLGFVTIACLPNAKPHASISSYCLFIAINI